MRVTNGFIDVVVDSSLCLPVHQVVRRMTLGSIKVLDVLPDMLEAA